MSMIIHISLFWIATIFHIVSMIAWWCFRRVISRYLNLSFSLTIHPSQTMFRKSAWKIEVFKEYDITHYAMIGVWSSFPRCVSCTFPHLFSLSYPILWMMSSANERTLPNPGNPNHFHIIDVKNHWRQWRALWQTRITMHCSQVQLPNGRATILSINAAYVQIAIYGMTASLFRTAHHYSILSIR